MTFLEKITKTFKKGLEIASQNWKTNKTSMRNTTCTALMLQKDFN